MHPIVEFAAFSLILFVGLLTLAKLGPHVHAFKWHEYVLLLSFPLLAVAVFTYRDGPEIVYIFSASAILGTFAEYSFGRAYHSLMGIRLWRYWRYSVQGYTSFLVLPLWGIAGVFFYFLSRSFT